MKAILKGLCVGVIVAFIAGCASDFVYVPKIPPQAEAKLLDYFNQPDNKVFVIAIDPSGEYAFGYDYGKSTLKEGAKTALEKCQANRKSRGIMAKPYIYAINNKVVYKEMIRKSEQARMSAGDKAQVNEAARQEATGEANQPSE